MRRPRKTYGVLVEATLQGAHVCGAGPDVEKGKEALRRDFVFPKWLGGPEEYAMTALELLTNGYMNCVVERLDVAAPLQPK